MYAQQTRYMRALYLGGGWQVDKQKLHKKTVCNGSIFDDSSTWVHKPMHLQVGTSYKALLHAHLFLSVTGLCVRKMSQYKTHSMRMPMYLQAYMHIILYLPQWQTRVVHSSQLVSIPSKFPDNDFKWQTNLKFNICTQNVHKGTGTYIPVYTHTHMPFYTCGHTCTYADIHT